MFKLYFGFTDFELKQNVIQYIVGHVGFWLINVTLLKMLLKLGHFF